MNSSTCIVTSAARLHPGCSLQGGAVGGGVQWMGVVLYNKNSLWYNVNHYTLFPLHPPFDESWHPNPRTRGVRVLRDVEAKACHHGPRVVTIAQPAHIIYIYIYVHNDNDNNSNNDNNNNNNNNYNHNNDNIMIIAYMLNRCIKCYKQQQIWKSGANDIYIYIHILYYIIYIYIYITIYIHIYNKCKLHLSVPSRPAPPPVVARRRCLYVCMCVYIYIYIYMNI